MPGAEYLRLMSLPDLLAEAVDGEDVVAHVSLGGDDTLAVTPTRTLVYRAEGLLSDETVEEYPHGVERIDASEGRRKAKLTLDYGLDGEETISLPAKRLDDALHPILAGVLSASGVTDAGESVLRTYRFSELTLVITSHRLVKHVGSAVWDDEYEEFHFSDVTDLDFEEGTVATSVVLTHGGRQERFKAPNESAREVRETLTDAVCEFHGVGSLEELRVTMADDEGDAGDDGGTTDFGDGPDPLSASPVADAEEEPEPPEAAAQDSTEPVEAGGTETAESDPGSAEATGSGSTGSGVAEAEAPREVATGAEAAGADAVETGDAFEGSPFESAVGDSDDLADEVAALRETVEAQSERLDRQAELIEQLIEELRRGR